MSVAQCHSTNTNTDGLGGGFIPSAVLRRPKQLEALRALKDTLQPQGSCYNA